MRWRTFVTGRLARVAAITGLLAVAGSVPAVARPFPEVRLYELLPSDYPYPLARVCYTHLCGSGSALRVPPRRRSVDLGGDHPLTGRAERRQPAAVPLSALTGSG